MFLFYYIYYILNTQLYKQAFAECIIEDPFTNQNLSIPEECEICPSWPIMPLITTICHKGKLEEFPCQSGHRCIQTGECIANCYGSAANYSLSLVNNNKCNISDEYSKSDILVDAGCKFCDGRDGVSRHIVTCAENLTKTECPSGSVCMENGFCDSKCVPMAKSCDVSGLNMTKYDRIPSGCKICDDSTKESYNPYVCVGSRLEEMTCELGTRCIEIKECELDCKFIDRKSCIVYREDRKFMVKDGCRFCLHKEDEPQKIATCKGRAGIEYSECDKDDRCDETMNISHNIYCNARCRPDETMKEKRRWIVIVAILGVISISVVLGLIIRYCFFKYRVKQLYVQKDFDLPEHQWKDISDMEITDGLFIINNNSFKTYYEDKLGEGGFGIVYKGELCMNSGGAQNNAKYFIAIKELKYQRFMGNYTLNAELMSLMQLKIQENDRKKMIERMIEEAKIMSKLKHPNVLSLYGICIANQNVRIITPYRRIGSLYGFLKKFGRKISGVMLLEVCQHIASAMSYLTSRNIVHGDLATRNVLLSGDIEDEQNPSTSNIIAQVSDFGLAQILHKNEISQRTTDALPIRWVAIECLEFVKKEFLKKTETPKFPKRPTLNEKTDVWSYGVTLWEIFTYGKTPYDVLLNENEGLTLTTTYSEFSSELNNLINGPGKISHTESATKTKEYTQNFDDIIFLLYFLKNEGGRLEKPPICNGELWNTITIDCWSEFPEQRLTFEQLKKKFEHALKNPSEYVIPENYDEKNEEIDLEKRAKIFHLEGKNMGKSFRYKPTSPMPTDQINTLSTLLEADSQS